MSLTHSRLSSNVLLALLVTLVFLIPSRNADAQSTPRNFQLSLVETGTALVPSPTKVDTDIRTYFYNNKGIPEPPGYYILQGLSYSSPLLTNLDWSRIVAVEVDEPYNSLDGYLDNDNCTPPPASAFTQIDIDLSNLAAKLKSLNPKARFWVNLDLNEADWIDKCILLGPGIVQTFNRPYFDVISVDWYNQYWSPNLQGFYEAVTEYPATPHQQVALVPGVFSASSSQPNQEPYWQGYFDYANSVNQTCNLPLGSQGVTGIFDGCLVWVVMGWETGDDAPGYNGLLDSTQGSQQNLAIWQAEVALPPGPSLETARWVENYIEPSLNLLLL